MNTTYRGSPVITLMVTCLGFFMVLLDASIVTVALPTIQANLHANLSDLQWVTPTPCPLLPSCSLLALLATGTGASAFSWPGWCSFSSARHSVGSLTHSSGSSSVV
jgi:MFS family permease